MAVNMHTLFLKFRYVVFISFIAQIDYSCNFLMYLFPFLLQFPATIQEQNVKR